VRRREKRDEVLLLAAVSGEIPADWMGEAADYSTEMRCHRHPFHRGIPAREGVEF